MITDADREAAAEFYSNDGRPKYLKADLLSGRWDHADIIQILARHRLQGQREMQEKAAKVADDYDTFDRDVAVSAAGAVAAVGIAQAIRAIEVG